MNSQIIAAALASALMGVATVGFAQTNSDRTFTQGESKRCGHLSGAARDQCDKEEATKTQGAAAQEPGASRSDASSSGQSAAGADTRTFTHGESKRCESLSGAAKAQCDKEEGTKTEGGAAEAASK